MAAPLISLMPLFLTGTLAVQIDKSIGLDIGQLGLATAAFFLTGALSSFPFGRLAARLGTVRSMQVGVVLSCGSMLATALFASSWVGIVVCLAVNGLSQAFTDPASGLYIARAIPRSRYGAAVGIKLAMVPLGALLSGLALPLIAVPLGWRRAFVAVALLFAVALLLPPRYRPSAESEPRRPAPVGMNSVLVAIVAGASLGFAATNVFSAFAVRSATASGLTPDLIGALVVAGGLLGAMARVAIGLAADRRLAVHPYELVTLLLCGAAGFLVLGLGPVAHMIVIPLTFVTAWAWAPLYQLMVVTEYHDPGSVFRVINSGIYGASVAAPIAFGAAVSAFGFAIAWLGVGVTAVVAALCFSFAGVRLRKANSLAEPAGG